MAFGHAELIASTPAANASLVEAPPELTLTFTEPIDPGSTRVRLLDERQAVVPGVGEPALDGASTTASLSLPALEPGTYTVDYQVTSAVDGHVTSGILAFLVDPSGTEPPPLVPSETQSLSSPPEAIAARWVALAAALALAGILIFWLLSARPALASSGLPEVRAPWAAVSIAAITTVAGLSIHLVLASRPIVEAGGAASGWFPLDPAGPYGWTPFAVAMRVALLGALAALALAALALAANHAASAPGVVARRERGWLLFVLAAAVIGLAGMSFAGHAASYGGPVLALVDLLHLLGVAAWLGTLVGLFLLARRANPALPAALRRHSRVALVAAPIVLLTGIANSPLVLGDRPRELLASGYGNLLLAKGLLFSVALAIGAANFMLVRRRVRKRAALPLIGVELGVAALAVLAAAGLVTGQPSAGRVPQLTSSAIGTTHLYGTAGESSVHIAVNLPNPGRQRYQVSVADAGTGAYRTDVQRVFLVFGPPAGSGLQAERVQLEASDEPWLWGATGAYTPVVGDWQLEIVVRRAGELDESETFPLPVSEALPPQQVPPPDTGIGIPAPLAALWWVLPAGSAGWGLVLALLALCGGLFLVGRRARRPSLVAIRVVAVLLAVVTGLGVSSRALVQAANAPPPGVAAEPNPVQATASSVQRGRDLYLANCSVCHGPDGAGDGPAAGPLSRPAPLSEAVPAQTDGSLAYRIAAGTAGTRMPAFADTLSESDRWDIVNYLRSEFGR